MLNLALDGDQQDVVEMTRDLGAAVLSPAAAATERGGAVDPAAWQALCGSGLTVLLSEDLGGDGIPSTVTQMTALEQLAHGDPQATIAAAWSGSAALFVSEHGSAMQRAALRDAAVTGPSHRGAVALYESAGSHEIATTVETDGARVRVRGRKVAVPFAERADTMIVLGRDPSNHELRAVVVPPGQEGMTVRPRAGSLGLDATEQAVVDFDLELPVEHLLAHEGLGLTVARHRLILAAVQTGMAQRALEYAGDYASQRIAFGKPIASFQGISFLIAEAFARTEQARLEILDAASLVDDGAPEDQVTAAVDAAVSYASENAAETTRNAVQVLGGHGFMTEYPVENWYRIAAFLSTVDFDPLASAFQPAF
ncbi:acyl-CoA dehydrogenase family protein [Nocardioides zeae]|uniref:Acyl-CoA dehydrogenase n=1 Tax=Nocardioides zeae TaxID=1457234 RepID=A0A6P0HNC3_9ACTN|nr:acyl-CoA dehydrogenase [Nocardioides zeae]NEN79727.1 acyl-CoA dehydrogenase [Nocardioides zeae]